MDKEVDKLVYYYISKVAEKNENLISAYIFGSYAKHIERPDSDIDVALIFDRLEDYEKFDVQVQLMLMASDFDCRIEPHPISQKDFNSNNPFVAEIKRTGVKIEILSRIA
jgi:uncharacterized protein